MMLLIHSDDNFTYNLLQDLRILGQDPVLIHSDNPALPALARDPELASVCLAAGPDRNGFCPQFLRDLPGQVPVLGIGLGQLVLATHLGCSIKRLTHPLHGKTALIDHSGQGLFAGLPIPFEAGLYCSLAVDCVNQSAIQLLAHCAELEVMAFQSLNKRWTGIQFHPESVLSPHGRTFLANFVAWAKTPSAAMPSAKTPKKKLEARNERPKALIQVSEVIETLARGEDLEAKAAEEIFSRLMDGELTPAQAGAFLMGLRSKGETPHELGAAARVALHRAVRLPELACRTIDIVGTGGDNKGSFNCSTATALTLAGMGHKVLKHGNRSVSSRSGSADVLEQLGIPLHAAPETIPRTLESAGFAFLFAPDYHPSFKNVMPLRRDLGVRTLFNILGPLVNPGKPPYRLLGAPFPHIAQLLADTIALEEDVTGAVVSGAGGYDELTVLGPASVLFVREGKVRSASLDPAQYGFQPCAEKDLTVEGPEDAARVMRELLHGRGGRAMRDMVALNTGLALYLLRADEESIDASLAYDGTLMTACMHTAKDAVARGAGRSFAHA